MSWDHPIVKDAVFGDESAIVFLKTVATTLHLWDDLIDKDKAVADEQINKAFHDLFITIPFNAFYQKYSSILHPVIVNSIINWHTANHFERNSPELHLHHKQIAFILRSSYIDILTMSAFLAGGMDHARAIAIRAREWAHEEGFTGYRANLDEERRQRDVLHQRT